MKVIGPILLAIFLIASPPSSARSAERATDPGSVMLGGGLSYSSISFSGSHADNLSVTTLAPRAMVFLVNGLALGVELAFVQSSQGSETSAAHRYLGNILFIAPLESAVRPYVQVGAGFIRQSESSGQPASSDSENGWAVGGGAGIYAFLNDHYAIRCGASFYHDVLMVSQGNTPSMNTVSFTVGFEGFVF